VWGRGRQKQVQTLSKKKPTQLISPEEIRALYARGEEAVVELVTGLVEHIAKLETRLTELEGIVKKNSSNSSKPPSGDGFGKKTKSLRIKSQKNTARTCEILSDVVGANISEGTLFNTRSQCFERLAANEEAIKTEIVASDVVHFDETGMRVSGKLWWLHVACTDGLTYYCVHSKRGREAIDQMEILPQFEGKAVHDGWKSYQDYKCEHYLCNAHHLRELTLIWEQYQQAWALQMFILLGSIKTAVDEAQATLKQVATEVLDAFEARYQQILDQGFGANPPPPPPPPTKHRRKSGGRLKQSPARNLLGRLQKHQTSVLGFMHDRDVPFDNNQAERDIRMVKLKQKISGTFRSVTGAKMFCRIRGYISTLRKRGLNVLDAFISLFSGHPQSPIPQPE
jgi:transposase